MTVADLDDLAPALPADFVQMLSARPADALSASTPDGATWLAALPSLVRDLADRWELTGDGPVLTGMAAVVVPVNVPRGRAALKVSWPHREADHEHLALRAWGGSGAVRLLAADPGVHALLLERLDFRRSLAEVDVDTSSATIGQLLRDLDRPALPQLDSLSGQSLRWLEQLRRDGDRVLPRRLVQRAIDALTQLRAEPGADDRLVHTDLHDANVLHRPGDGWVAIDPKPLNASPEFALACMVWNRSADAERAGSARSHWRRKVEIACAAGNLDPERAMLWTMVRCSLNAIWALEDGESPASDYVTRQVSIAKAMLE
ncbi:aminoglycoside phosphotransferase family protein [Dermacoccaceae bacterium W4C1]